MSVSVNMWSGIPGELRCFLEKYYEKEVDVNNHTGGWFFECSPPLESVDIISALMDNSEKYDIVMYVQVNNSELYRITEENYNDVIKGLFILFYDKPEQVSIRRNG